MAALVALYRYMHRPVTLAHAHIAGGTAGTLQRDGRGSTEVRKGEQIPGLSRGGARGGAPQLWGVPFRAHAHTREREVNHRRGEPCDVQHLPV